MVSRFKVKKMSAKAILVPKINSFQFDDKILTLDVPAKIGRSHKDDRAESGNGFFDSKVLSKQHALILYEEGKFFLMDTGSSNGTFVNNIRLSKSLEESKMTEIFNGDILRFGSDVVDKSRQVTQKCIISKVKLVHPDGSEGMMRSSQSRLYRPNDEFDDMYALTASLQEALSREKFLEDKLTKVRAMISKHIGRSQTDLIRIFEDIKEEIMSLYDETVASKDNTKIDDKVRVRKIMSKVEKKLIHIYDIFQLLAENTLLLEKLKDLEKKNAEKEQTVSIIKRKMQADEVEASTMKKVCQMQKDEIAGLEHEIARLQSDAENQDAKMMEIEGNYRDEMKAMRNDLESQMTRQEDELNAEITNLKTRLHDVTSNEINLLNRIKSLESEESYARAEVEKAAVKERDIAELQQRLEYKIECLEGELTQAHQVRLCG